MQILLLQTTTIDFQNCSHMNMKSQVNTGLINKTNCGPIPFTSRLRNYAQEQRPDSVWPK